MNREIHDDDVRWDKISDCDDVRCHKLSSCSCYDRVPASFAFSLLWRWFLALGYRVILFAAATDVTESATLAKVTVAVIPVILLAMGDACWAVDMRTLLPAFSGRPILGGLAIEWQYLHHPSALRAYFVKL